MHVIYYYRITDLSCIYLLANKIKTNCDIRTFLNKYENYSLLIFNQKTVAPSFMNILVYQNNILVFQNNLA